QAVRSAVRRHGGATSGSLTTPGQSHRGSATPGKRRSDLMVPQPPWRSYQNLSCAAYLGESLGFPRTAPVFVPWNCGVARGGETLLRRRAIAAIVTARPRLAVRNPGNALGALSSESFQWPCAGSRQRRSRRRASTNERSYPA